MVLVLLVAVLFSILIMVLISNRGDEEKEDLVDKEVVSTES